MQVLRAGLRERERESVLAEVESLLSFLSPEYTHFQGGSMHIVSCNTNGLYLQKIQISLASQLSYTTTCI